jgi:hypothetical protein
MLFQRNVSQMDWNDGDMKKTPVSLPWIGFLLTLQCETGLHLCAPLACGLETFRLHAPRQRASMKHQELIYISFITYVRPS